MLPLGANADAAAGSADELTGEAAIDLTAAGILPAGGSATECITFANVIAATVTGNSDTADFKDTILADTSGVGISNCGQVRVTKETNPDDQSGSFPYTLTRNPASALPLRRDHVLPGTLTSDGDSDLDRQPQGRQRLHALRGRARPGVDEGRDQLREGQQDLQRRSRAEKFR